MSWLAGVPDLAWVILGSIIAPCFVYELFQIDFGLPVEEEFGFGIVKPSTLVLRFDVNRGKTLSFVKVFGNLAVVDRFVHAGVEKLLSGFGVVDREKNGRNQILHDERNFSLPVGLQGQASPVWSRRIRRMKASSGETKSRHTGPPKTSLPKEREYLKSSFSMIQGARRQQPLRSYWV